MGSWPRVRKDGLLAWPSLDGTAVTRDHQHQPRTGIMPVGADHVTVTYCGRCGAIKDQRTLTREEQLHVRTR